MARKGSRVEGFWMAVGFSYPEGVFCRHEVPQAKTGRRRGEGKEGKVSGRGGCNSSACAWMAVGFSFPAFLIWGAS